MHSCTAGLGIHPPKAEKITVVCQIENYICVNLTLDKLFFNHKIAVGPLSGGR